MSTSRVPPPPADLESAFAHNARVRGQAYFAEGRVTITAAEPTGVEATVRGTEVYQVALVRDGRLLVGSCNCPHCLEGSACKHLWAAILAARARGIFVTPAPTDFELDWETIDGALDDADAFGDEAGSDWFRPPAPAPARRGGPRYGHTAWTPAPPPPPKPKTWRDHLTEAQAMLVRPPPASRAGDQQLLYLVDPVGAAQVLTIQLAARERKANGDWGKVKTTGYVPASDTGDRTVRALMRGCTTYGYFGAGDVLSLSVPVGIPADLHRALIPAICSTGRFHVRRPDGALGRSLEWDAAAVWELSLAGTRDERSDTVVVQGTLDRGDRSLPLHAPELDLIVAGGVVICEGVVAPLRDFGASHWVHALRRQGTMAVPLAEVPALVETVAACPGLRLTLPEELRWETRLERPAPRADIKAPGPRDYPHDKLQVHVSFDYAGTRVPWHDGRPAVVSAETRSVLVRDPESERAAIDALLALGLRRSAYAPRDTSFFELPPKRLPAVVRALNDQGWQVEAEGRVHRTPQRVDIAVTSGIDWFDVHGEVVFDGTVVPLPALLAAARRGESVVPLGDGTVGLLPEEWLARHGLLASCGEETGGGLRFRRTQVWLLDELLAGQPEASFDEGFAKARAELASFDGVQPADPAPSFAGTLRAYQREGLGWLRFLERFGFGGCLADDMGLGKTVQVLAHLESRRASGVASGPSLIVVPKSLVFNWQAEARRFAPALRLLDYTGPAKARAEAPLDAHDVVVTTYGLLRRDAARLKDIAFDLVVLDEAHAIKNASSAAAKAARLLKGRIRLALSGTPVQNHLGELWSLFEFLNPGMLGSGRLFGGASGRAAAEDSSRLARALRPFLLRRTKEAVARELPARIEQTVYCEIDGPQRALYQQLRDHYRTTLQAKIEQQGLAKAKMHVLEALLRLRQAACHPGLVDPSRADEDSAKLEVLLARLEEITEEGRKALVFSQFTTFLGLLRKRLDAEGVTYEYLDGRTRDREAKVRRFQEDPDCPLFLISLKAGGLGLNLTAADSVFLLDPWWNPAIEAQAIDRAHRIGQTKSVYACRLIVKDSVEEKILELQAQKRALADSILAADAGLLGQLTREDLDLLLG